MISAEYNSNVLGFLNKFNRNKDVTLKRIGELGQKNIRSETPVDSGLLKSDNRYFIENDNKVIFYNNTAYARYVELGTIYQSANPFTRRGLAKSYTGFVAIAVKTLRV